MFRLISVVLTGWLLFFTHEIQAQTITQAPTLTTTVERVERVPSTTVATPRATTVTTVQPPPATTVTTVRPPPATTVTTVEPTRPTTVTTVESGPAPTEHVVVTPPPKSVSCTTIKAHWEGNVWVDTQSVCQYPNRSEGVAWVQDYWTCSTANLEGQCTTWEYKPGYWVKSLPTP